MAVWRVSGVNLNTGSQASVFVRATDAADAQAKARKQNILAESTEAVPDDAGVVVADVEAASNYRPAGKASAGRGKSMALLAVVCILIAAGAAIYIWKPSNPFRSYNSSDATEAAYASIRKHAPGVKIIGGGEAAVPFTKGLWSVMGRAENIPAMGTQIEGLYVAQVKETLWGLEVTYLQVGGHVYFGTLVE